jgi:hypothetical protein
LIGEFRDDGKLYFIKRLIAGLNPFNRKPIYDAVQDLKTNKCPFSNLPEKASEHQYAVTEEVMQKCVWLNPKQLAEIAFIERTPHGRLRHASFRHLLQGREKSKGLGDDAFVNSGAQRFILSSSRIQRLQADLRERTFRLYCGAPSHAMAANSGSHPESGSV